MPLPACQPFGAYALLATEIAGKTGSELGNGQGLQEEGQMLAIELVKDCKTKESAPEKAQAVFEATRRNSLVASRSGPYRNVIRMCPPLCLSMNDVGDVMGRFVRSFEVPGA